MATGTRLFLVEALVRRPFWIRRRAMLTLSQRVHYDHYGRYELCNSLSADNVLVRIPTELSEISVQASRAT